MPIDDSLKFPSGRSVKRLKQDAKALAKDKKIPLHQALDIVAQLNGGVGGWDDSLRALRDGPDVRHVEPNLKRRSRLASELGITDDELALLSYEIDANTSNDDLIYNYILTFDEDCPPEILQKIGLDDDSTVQVSVNAFDEEPEPDPEPDAYEIAYPRKTDMNPFRKLLVVGINKLLMRGLLSLEWDGVSNEDTAHIETMVAGYNTIIAWSGIGMGEVRISVWWNYDHSKHPQANAYGNHRESFSTASPLAKRRRYPEFVGAVCNGWLERQEGKYLMGTGDRGLLETYMRKAEKGLLAVLPNPRPFGFAAEGPFHN